MFESVKLSAMKPNIPNIGHIPLEMIPEKGPANKKYKKQQKNYLPHLVESTVIGGSGGGQVVADCLV